MLKNYGNLLILLLLFSSSAAFAQDYTTAIKNQLNTNRSALGVQASDIQDFKISDEVLTRHNGVTHVYVMQQVNGIPIKNAIVNAAFKNGSIVYLSESLESNIIERATASNPTLNPIQAATSAATALGLGNAAFQIQSAVSSQEFMLNTGNVSLENVPVRLVYASTKEEDLKLAWDLSIHTSDSKHWWSVRVDAINGNIIDKNDWVVSCNFESHNHKSKRESKVKKSFLVKEQNLSLAFAGEQYKVFPLPLESPNHGDAEVVVNPQDLEASPFGWHDTDGIEGAEFTTTRGNNVWAQEDRDGDNGTGDSPEGGNDLNFNFEFNLPSNPINFQEAAITNLFYWNNIMHDVFYYYGFNEAAGNFQETNYGGAIGGSDSVSADAQDGSRTNNATFATPSDGFNPKMQMHLFAPSGPAGESVLINGGPLNGGYQGTPAVFGEPLPEDEPITGNLVVVNDNNESAESDDETDGCDTILNGAEVVGNIAVLRRGACEFGQKVLNAENEGAIAVIVVNNVAGDPIAMAPGDVGDQVTISSIMVSQEDGEAIIDAIQNGEIVNVSLLNAGPFEIDSDLDNGIIIHEYGHGISNRLTGGRSNSNCMTTCVEIEDGNCVQGSEVMSEGWSDYFALMLTLENGDAGEDVRGIGTYAIGQSTDGGGIRPTPYSTDLAINNSTYNFVVEDFADGTAPHPVGYVWSTMLWDMTWGLIDEFGYSDNVYSGTGGNNIALQLVVDGLKLQPCNPGFVDGRDAILAAVEVNPLLVNENMRRAAACRVWTAFATRGLGWSAEQGDWRVRADGSAAFDFPPESLDPCQPLSISDRTNVEFKVFPNPSNGEININVGNNIGKGSVKIFDINGREVFTAQKALEGTVRIQAQGLATGIYLLQIQNEVVSQTTKIVIE